MTDNPIIDRKPDKRIGKIGLQRLRDYCDWLNDQPWVKSRYFIAENVRADGSVDYRLAQ